MKKAVLAAGVLLAAAAGMGEEIGIDPGWEFAIGKGKCKFAKTGHCGRHGIDLGGLKFEKVDLPHDWALGLPFHPGDPEDKGDNGYKAVGRAFPENSVGWYRREVYIPKEWEGDRVWVRFDGVFRDSKVWMNLAYLGGNESGYIGKTYDIGDVVEYGRTNSLLVRADVSCNEGWWYEGAGIYRHVWLVRKPPVHIPEAGVYARSEVGGGGKAKVKVRVGARNDSGEGCEAGIGVKLFAPGGKGLAAEGEKRVRIGAGRGVEEEFELEVEKAELWSPEEPALYRLEVRVGGGGREDREEVAVGLRTVEFDAERGFLLNGKRVQIKGAAVHQDAGCVGVAVPDAVWEYRIKRLKSMGANAVRTAHNPPSPQFLDACDRLGMMVMDETRGFMSGGPHMETFERMILRDRNHASVIIWSLGNEEGAVHATAAGERIARRMMARQRELDPSRAVTYGGNGGGADGVNAVVDVRGVNYVRIGNEGREEGKWAIDDYRRRHPRQPVVGTEEASVISTRGELESSRERGYMADADRRENAVHGWCLGAEEWVNFYAKRPWMAGAFFWTGFDYRGETGPWHWPTVVGQYGAMDLCGFAKSGYWLYRSWWREDEDVLHVEPDWDEAGKAGKKIEVRAITNAKTAELRVNGRSMGVKRVGELSHASWEVDYEPGAIEVTAEFEGGRRKTARRETSGPAAELRLESGRSELKADGHDAWVVDVAAYDAAGREAASAGDMVEFAARGPARIIGVGNGDNSSHEPEVCADGAWRRRLFHGKAQVVLRTTQEAGEVVLEARLAGGKGRAEIEVKSRFAR